MSLFTLGRYGTVLLFLFMLLKDFLPDRNFHLISSVSAGCRGGFLLCAINAFTCRIKLHLFEALTKQEIGFFGTVKTGKAAFIWHPNVK